MRQKTWVEWLHAVLTVLDTAGMSFLVGPTRKKP